VSGRISISPQAYVDNGITLTRNGLFQLAINKFNEALSISPYYSPAIWCKCFAQLMMGDFSGWAEYEWFNPLYKPRKGWFKRRLDKPLWNGSSLDGKRIFLYCDEGCGDFFQFLRYAKLIENLGGYTIVEALPDTRALLGSCNYINHIVEYGNQTVEYDIHCPLMLAPRFFDITSGYIPNDIPYLYGLFPTNNEFQKFFETSEFKIGVACSGNPEHSHDAERSINPHAFNSLSKCNASIYNLQKGKFTEGMISCGYMIKDWLDTAYIISKMDLIITVDTALAHLAGAMGKEVWLLIKPNLDWRWITNRTDSPWYPSMRIFHLVSTWSDLIDQIVEIITKTKMT
jgi:hypothetical protein